MGLGACRSGGFRVGLGACRSGGFRVSLGACRSGGFRVSLGACRRAWSDMSEPLAHALSVGSGQGAVSDGRACPGSGPPTPQGLAAARSMDDGFRMRRGDWCAFFFHPVLEFARMGITT